MATLKALADTYFTSSHTQNSTGLLLPQVHPHGHGPFDCVAAASLPQELEAASLQNIIRAHLHSLSLLPPQQHLHEHGPLSAHWVDRVGISALEERRTSLEKILSEVPFIQPCDSNMMIPHPNPSMHCHTQIQNPSTSDPSAKDSQLSGLLLACPWDRGVLTDHLIYLRQQLEFFRATKDDTKSHTRGRSKTITMQQVGIRCRHCSHITVGQRQKASTYFPSTLMGIYQAAQNIGVEHMQSGACMYMLPDVKRILLETKESKKTTTSGAGKAYWAESAKSMGLIDTIDGIRFAADVTKGSSLAISSMSTETFFS